MGAGRRTICQPGAPGWRGKRAVRGAEESRRRGRKRNGERPGGGVGRAEESLRCGGREVQATLGRTAGETNMHRALRCILAAWLVGLSGSAAASDSQAERVTLTGLTPLSVVVEDLAPIAEKNGVTGAALQADVERRLRQAGITLTPDADAYLYVHVTGADPGAPAPLPYV